MKYLAWWPPSCFLEMWDVVSVERSQSEGSLEPLYSTKVRRHQQSRHRLLWAGDVSVSSVRGFILQESMEWKERS